MSERKLPPVSPRCGVILNIDTVRSATEWKSCGKPTTHWYPTMGGGTMPLCAAHAERHLPHGAWPLGTLPPYPLDTRTEQKAAAAPRTEGET
jgi:hypothetical protein